MDPQNHGAQMTILRRVETSWAVSDNETLWTSTKHRPCDTFRYRTYCRGRLPDQGQFASCKELLVYSKIDRRQGSVHTVQIAFSSCSCVLGRHKVLSGRSICNTESMECASVLNFRRFSSYQKTNWQQDTGSCRVQRLSQLVLAVVGFPD